MLFCKPLWMKLRLLSFAGFSGFFNFSHIHDNIRMRLAMVTTVSRKRAQWTTDHSQKLEALFDFGF
jgi:hypothetical protein